MPTAIATQSNIEATSRRHLLKQLDACRSYPCCISLETTIDPLAWVAAQPTDVKVVWRDRHDDTTWAGSGAAHMAAAGDGESIGQLVGRCRDLLHRIPQGLRWFGGFAFQPKGGPLAAPWTQWSRGQFWLPRATLHDQQLHIVVLDSLDAAMVRDWLMSDQLVVQGAELSTLAPYTRRTNRPAETEWQTSVEQALAMFASEVLEKIVLARQVTLDFDESVDPWSLLCQLSRRALHSYLFAFQAAPSRVFLGATPERLFRRHGNEFESEVVAGTRRRGATADADRQLGNELLACEKDQLEHHIVRKAIRQRLHGCVDHLQVDSYATLLKLATKQHLYSRVSGSLRAGVGEADLLSRLHPTPAVGGYPTENALAEIARLEPFERGWYAAPVGWLDHSGAEFVVAIRSALVADRQLHLYSGAGIVPGSTATAEWDEIEAKICDLLQWVAPQHDLRLLPDDPLNPSSAKIRPSTNDCTHGV